MAGMIRRVRSKAKDVKVQARAVRASISFPTDVYKTLDEIAKKKKVSLAWVVREAAENYIAELHPLFGRNKTQ
jgi:metal-responsive CopG/Arc/MetJ family transcriptional regulator